MNTVAQLGAVRTNTTVAYTPHRRGVTAAPTQRRDREQVVANFDTLRMIIELFGALALIISLVAVARSNRRVAASVRMSNLQAMLVEMNGLRRLRSDDPSLERSLFDTRTGWSDLQIKQNLMAVQLANILEWAFLARRDGLLERDVWESWVTTWRTVILASEPLRATLQDSVWTFGRSPEMKSVLDEVLSGTGDIPDPIRKTSRAAEWLTGS